MAYQPKKYVIVGNGIAGTTAAETLRKNDPNCQITLITDEEYPLYNRVALPRYVKGIIAKPKVYVRDLAFHIEKGIQLLISNTVTAVNWEERTVLTDKGQEFAYDKLLIATGGRPNRLQAPGADAAGIFNFQYMDEAKGILDCLETARCAVTTGGSYIAYELTEAFVERKINTTWLIRGPRFLRRVLDEDGGRLVDLIARERGADVIYGEEIKAVIPKNGQVGKVVTTSGRELEADLVGCGLGLTMNVELLANTPAKVNVGIITNEYLETGVPDIYAAGDVAEFYDVVIERHNRMGTWPNSQDHGRIAATNMMGGHEAFVDVPNYSSTLFTSTIVAMGLTPEMDTDLQSVSKTDFVGKNYRELFFKGNRLVGAVIIGRPQGKKKLQDMILHKVKVTGPKEALLEIS